MERDKNISNMVRYDNKKLINYKNKLKDEARQYYKWASVNENKAEGGKELAMYEMLKKIADDLDKIIYG